LTEQVKSLK